jgi:RND family efflux transporter MFP subunit
MITLHRKPFAVLVFVAALSAATLSGLAACGSPQNPPPAAAVRGPRAITVRVAPAIIGNISVSTAYAAIVEAKDQVNVVPLATGRLEKLNVDVGSEVQRGQVIAELSHGILDAQLQQAQAALRNAQAKLAAVIGTSSAKGTEAYTPLGVAHARLDQLLKPSASDLQVAESAVATAQANLDSARTKLDQLLKPSASDLQVAETAVATAQANLDSASTKLDQLLNPTAAQLTSAQAATADAQNKLRTARANVNLAIATELSPRVAMSSELRTWWQTLLDARLSVESNIATLENLQPAFGLELSPADIAGAQQIVAANQAAISSLLKQISASSLIPQGISTAMWAETSAQVALDNARAKLRELQTPSPNAIALEQYNVGSAQASLDSAKAKLRELQSPSQNAIALAVYNVSAAQASLSAAAARLNSLKKPDPAALAAARAAVTAAEQEVISSQALVDQAHGQVNLVKQQLAETQVLAPFDGFVTKRWLAPGAMASPQTPVVTIAGKDVVVSLRVEETGISSLQKGQRVTFTSPALPGQRLDLQIDQIAPTGDEKAHTFSVQMRPVDATPGLKPGMSGEVSIATRHEKVVLVPKEAVLYRSGLPTVFVVQDGKAQLRKVDGGLSDNKNIEIQNGLQPDDQVVVSGQNLLNEGDLVTLEGPTERRRPPG